MKMLLILIFVLINTFSLKNAYTEHLICVQDRDDTFGISKFDLHPNAANCLIDPSKNFIKKRQVLKTIQSVTDSIYNYIWSNELDKWEVTINNSKGNIIEKREFGPNGEVGFNYVYSYHTNDKLIQMEMMKEDGSRFNLVKYFYSEKGLLRQKLRLNSFDQALNNTVYKYNTDGELIEELDYDHNAELYKRLTYEYDQLGNVTEEKYYEADSTLVYHYTNYYNESGYKVKQERAPTKYKKATSQTFEYDDHGNLLEKLEFRGRWKSELAIHKYDYDQYGNWVNKYYNYRGHWQIMNKRKIEYFE